MIIIVTIATIPITLQQLQLTYDFKLLYDFAQIGRKFFIT